MPPTNFASSAIPSAGQNTFDESQLAAARAGAGQAGLRSLVLAELGVITNAPTWPEGRLVREAHGAWLAWLERMHAETYAAYAQSYLAAYRFTEHVANDPEHRMQLAQDTENSIRESAEAERLSALSEVRGSENVNGVDRDGRAGTGERVPAMRVRPGGDGPTARRAAGAPNPQTHPWRKSLGAARIAG